MKIGNNEYKEKTILINNWGYYIDFLLDRISKNNFVSIENLDSVNKTKILLYPKFSELEKYFDCIISKPLIIVLHTHQVEEYKMLSPYFKDQRFKFDRNNFFKFLGLESFEDSELLEIAKKKDKFKIVYIFLQCFDPYHFNPSYFKSMFTDENWMFAYPLANFNFGDNKKKFSEYLSRNTNPNRETALKLLFEDLTEVKNESS